MLIDGKEVKQIVIRNSKGDDVIYISSEEIINSTDNKIIVTFKDGTVMDK